MSIPIEGLIKTIKENTIGGKMHWTPTSTGTGFMSANLKGSVKIEKSDISQSLILKFLNTNGLSLETFKLTKVEPNYEALFFLYEFIRKNVYQIDQQITDILSEITNPTIPDFNIAYAFLGVWQNNFILNQKPGLETFRVEPPNKYIVQGKHWFNLIDVTYDPKNSTLQFTKVGLGEDKRRVINKLKVIQFGLKYEGEESESESNRSESVIYTRIT